MTSNVSLAHRAAHVKRHGRDDFLGRLALVLREVHEQPPHARPAGLCQAQDIALPTHPGHRGLEGNADPRGGLPENHAQGLVLHQRRIISRLDTFLDFQGKVHDVKNLLLRQILRVDKISYYVCIHGFQSPFSSNLFCYCLASYFISFHFFNFSIFYFLPCPFTFVAFAPFLWHPAIFSAFQGVGRDGIGRHMF